MKIATAAWEARKLMRAARVGTLATSVQGQPDHRLEDDPEQEQRRQPEHKRLAPAVTHQPSALGIRRVSTSVFV